MLILAVLLVVAACGGDDSAQTTTTAPPSTTTAAPSTTTSAAPTTTTTLATDRLAAFAESWSETNEQGVVLAVVPANGEAQLFAAGFADQEVGTAVKPDDVFYVGSLTKPDVATVVMQLVEEGLVDLDAPVETYLPDVLAGEPVTVRHVLSHQSGVFNITDYPALVIGLFSDPFQEVTPQQVIDIALEQDRLFVPGEQFSYSNTNYLIAGSIVEAVTGNSLADELESRVYAPLDLHDMRFAGDPGRTVVNGFTHFDGDREPDPTKPLLESTLYTVAWAAGGLAATAGEFATFVSGAFEGPLLGSDSVATMTTSAGSEYGYGLGVLVEELGDETVWGHGGATPGLPLAVLLLPRRRSRPGRLYQRRGRQPLDFRRDSSRNHSRRPVIRHPTAPHATY